MSLKRTNSTFPTSLPWIFSGAAIAPLCIIVLSYIHADPDMKILPILLFVALTGAAGGYSVSLINPLDEPDGWNKAALIFLSTATYVFAVFLGFVIARLGPF